MENRRTKIYKSFKTVKSKRFRSYEWLRRRANGHLGLICTAAEYLNLNPTAYVQHVRPGPLVILAIEIALHAATRLRKNHKDRLRVFRETINVQKALTKQIIQAIEPKYFNALRNRTTNTISVDVQTIFAHIVCRYRTVEDDTLAEKE